VRNLRPTAIVLVLTAGVSGCVTAPLTRTAYDAPRPLPPPPSPRVSFYPAQGQTPAQQDRDRYECYRWAVAQTGFDPSRQEVAPHQRVTVVAASQPGVNTTAGAFTGAVVGAAVSNPRSAGAGAIVGAVAGALLGATADAANAANLASQQNIQRASEPEDRQADPFRRAMSACLAGRGYSVQ